MNTCAGQGAFKVAELSVMGCLFPKSINMEAWGRRVYRKLRDPKAGLAF